VTITVNPVNSKPAANNQTVETNEGESVEIILTGSDAETSDLIFSVDEDSIQNGTLVVEGSKVTYTPTKGYNGEDSFTFTVTDLGDGSAEAKTSEAAIVEILVKPYLDGWVGNREQGDETPIILLRGNPLKISAVSSLDADKVIATYSYKSNDLEIIEQVELTLSNEDTADLDNEKVWTNIEYYLPDHILQDEYEVTFIAYDASNNEVQTEDQIRIGEDNKFHVRTNINLEGTITDQETKEIIEGAKVTLFDSTGSIQIGEVFTKADGKYTFENIKTNTYLIVIQKSGYAVKRSSIYAIPENIEDTTIKKDFELVEFSLELFADPSAIVGDGKSTSQLNALLKDKDGNVIPGVDVEFTAPRGSFENSTDLLTAVSQTNEQGKAFVTYASEKIEGVNSQSIVVQAKAEYNGLIAIEQIIVTFLPGSVKGIVTQNEDLDGDGKPDPIEGATVIITKDFDGDGNIDFSEKAITDSEGKYSIAIPRGDVDYDVTIIKTIELDNETKEVEFHQSAEVGEVTGKGDEDFDSTKTITGLIASKESSGDSELTPPVDHNMKVYLKDSDDQYLLDNEGQPIGHTVDNNGIFNAEDIKLGEYTLEVRYVHDDGEEIIINEREDGTLPKVKVTDDGQLNIVEELIDPYGVITDQKTGEIIEGAKVILFYADTQRNRDNGITPGTRVELPELVDFAPNDNHNPQYSDSYGNYAYMVYSYTDYYLIATKNGYYTYTSPTISVEEAIVRHDIEMEKKPGGNSGGTESPSTGGEEENQMDVATNLSLEQSIYPEGSQAPVKVDFINLSEKMLNKGTLQVKIPSDVKVIDADGGIVEGTIISWDLENVASDEIISYEMMIELPMIDSEEKLLELTSDFIYSGELVHPEWAKSSVKLKVVSNRYGSHEHERYIMGYPDGTFKSEKSLTRAELAAMMARLIGKYNSEEAFYSDVDSEHWAYKYINVVTEEGLFNGYTNNEFRPDQAITRAELVSVMTRYLKLNVSAPIETHFEDIETHWAEAAIEALYRNGMINGYEDGTFKPSNSITRTETVVLINNMLYRGPLENIAPTFPDVDSSYWGFGHIEEASVSHESEYEERHEEFVKELKDQVE
ncbi:S-layer homology domain-containing protein, partial [Chengkuizengella axinellae]